MKNKGMLFSTLLLAGVNVLIRVLGFGYRIVLVRLMGSEALGLFELLSPIIMLIFTLIGSGVPIAVIRLTSQSITKKNYSQGFLVTETISYVMIGVSFLLMISLYVTGPFISNVIIKDERLLTPLYIFAPAVIFSSLSATLRGYFYGVKNVIPPALSQLTEQITRMMVVFILLSLLYPFQTHTAVSVSMIGTVAGELMGMTLLFFLFHRAKKQCKASRESSHYSLMKTLGSFFVIALPITLSRAISSLLRVVTSIIVPQRLMVSGLDSSTALSYFGQVNGMVMPLLFLPFTLTSALVVNLIPRISDAVESNNQGLLHSYIGKTLHIAFLIGLPVSGFYYVFSNEILWVLYGEPLGLLLSRLSIGALLLCVYQISASIMQGMGKQLVSTIYFVGGLLVQLILTYTLVAHPAYQIQGYIFSFIVCFFMVALLNVSYIFYRTKVKIQVVKWVLTPLICVVLSLLLSKLFHLFIIQIFNGYLSLLLTLTMMAISYLGGLYLSKNITLAKGEK